MVCVCLLRRLTGIVVWRYCAFSLSAAIARLRSTHILWALRQATATQNRKKKLKNSITLAIRIACTHNRIEQSSQLLSGAIECSILSILLWWLYRASSVCCWWCGWYGPFWVPNHSTAHYYTPYVCNTLESEWLLAVLKILTHKSMLSMCARCAHTQFDCDRLLFIGDRVMSQLFAAAPPNIGGAAIHSAFKNVLFAGRLMYMFYGQSIGLERRSHCDL